MSWIEERRRGMGWTREQLGRAARCSGALIGILEDQHGGVTHPKIAARIARVLRASDAEWGSIVPKEYRGNGTEAYLDVRAIRSANRSGSGGQNRKPVAVIDRQGRVLRIYESINRTSAEHGVSEYFVWKRCNQIPTKTKDYDEFARLGVSFRWAADVKEAM